MQTVDDPGIDTDTPQPNQWRGPLSAAAVTLAIIAALFYAPWLTIAFAAGAAFAWCWPPDCDDFPS